MNYYEADKNRAWERRLVVEWNKINKVLRVNRINLETPSFEIFDRAKQWATYFSGDNPRIALSRNLVRNFGWGAVTMVLKHEAAHYVVDKAWHMGDLNSHGEAFKKACGIFGIDPSSCMNVKHLLEADTTAEAREVVVSKIRKIMAMTESSERGEAENALRKAQELMLKHNITSLEDRENEDYVFRPVGPIMGRIPMGVRILANVMKDFYFVNNIWKYFEGEKRYYEFFGAKENVDLAEYIFECLLRQGENLWKEYTNEIRAKHGRVRGVVSKARFFTGLYTGYRSKLQEQRKVREEQHASNALVWVGDPLMDEIYKMSYPDAVTTRHHSFARSGGYNDGYERGRGMTVNRAITGEKASRRGKLLV